MGAWGSSLPPCMLNAFHLKHISGIFLHGAPSTTNEAHKRHPRSHTGRSGKPSRRMTRTAAAAERSSMPSRRMTRIAVAHIVWRAKQRPSSSRGSSTESRNNRTAGILQLEQGTEAYPASPNGQSPLLTARAASSRRQAHKETHTHTTRGLD